MALLFCGVAYVDLEQARSRNGAFIVEPYNADHLFSALDYKSPAAFEAEWREAEYRKRQTLLALAPN
ncbi:MAG: hypothetical protein ACLPN5_00955 [Roseiarcus sp.]